MILKDELKILQDKIEFLEKELTKQKKISAALTTRVKRSMQISDNHYSRFESNILIQKQIEIRTDTLQREKEDAERKNREKSEFFSSMSHELRSPMHGILSFSKLGEDQFLNADRDKMGRFFTAINRSGKRLLRLIDDLLDLAKLESGKFQIDITENNLCEIVKNTIQENSELARNKEIEIEFFNNDAPEITDLDADRATQIVQNLLSNAIKFSPEKSHILLRCEKGSLKKLPAIKFSIADNGMGIPDKEHKLIFEKYVQSSNNKQKVGSTGLGLPICKELINLHNGKIWVENNINKGAVFSFVLPLAYSEDSDF